MCALFQHSNLAIGIVSIIRVLLLLLLILFLYDYKNLYIFSLSCPVPYTSPIISLLFQFGAGLLLSIYHYSAALAILAPQFEVFKILDLV